MFIKTHKNKCTLNEDLGRYIYIISRSILLIMRNVSDKIVGKYRTHVKCSVTFSRQSGKVAQTTDENMAHAHLHAG
jgi:hypothetical protein